MAAERFQYSGETISRHFRKVLKAVCRLGKEIITPPSFDTTPPEILFNPKYYPFFKVRSISLRYNLLLYIYSLL